MLYTEGINRSESDRFKLLSNQALIKDDISAGAYSRGAFLLESSGRMILRIAEVFLYYA